MDQLTFNCPMRKFVEFIVGICNDITTTMAFQVNNSSKALKGSKVAVIY